ncbi:MAG: ABC transporter permease subunit [Dysgonamonadaceae bacterium]|jgi:phosphate transport system permease protein|nr:ABC transporter permease subunit [Dysgonamonadaceae bacterium]
MRTRLKHPVLVDRICFVIVCLFSVIALTPFIILVFELFKRGFKQFNWDFFTETAPGSVEAMLAQIGGHPVTGGIVNGIYGSLAVILIAVGFAVPIGIFAGIYIYEKQTCKLSTAVQYAGIILKGTSSVIVGLVAYLWISLFFDHSPVLAGGLSLTILLLPSIIQSTWHTLLSIPENLKESGFALGASYSNVWFQIILPSVRKPLLSRILTSSTPIVGSTAPLIIAVLGSSAINRDVDNSATTLSLLIWRFFNHPNMVDLMWGASLFLFLIVVMLNLINRHLKKNRHEK